MSENKYTFFHWGPFLVHTTMSKELCELLLDEGRKVRDNPDKLHTTQLAGHLNEEYRLNLEKIIPELQTFLEGYCSGYAKWRGADTLKPRAHISGLWINYMKAGDFNPPHSHGGDLSFVAYPDVPQEIIEECEAFEGTLRGPGGVSWIYGDGDNTCISIVHQLPKTGDIYIFPAMLKHWVFPFKSAVTRVSVSGNIKFDQNQ